MAEEIALVADVLRGNQSPMKTHHWAGDIRSHFENDILFRGQRKNPDRGDSIYTKQPLPGVGTAYGMSALFMLEALKAQGEDTHLTTVEGSQLQHLTASQMLKPLW